METSLFTRQCNHPSVATCMASSANKSTERFTTATTTVKKTTITTTTATSVIQVVISTHNTTTLSTACIHSLTIPSALQFKRKFSARIIACAFRYRVTQSAVSWWWTTSVLFLNMTSEPPTLGNSRRTLSRQNCGYIFPENRVNNDTKALSKSTVHYLSTNLASAILQ